MRSGNEPANCLGPGQRRPEPEHFWGFWIPAFARTTGCLPTEASEHNSNLHARFILAGSYPRTFPRRLCLRNAARGGGRRITQWFQNLEPLAWPGRIPRYGVSRLCLGTRRELGATDVPKAHPCLLLFALWPSTDESRRAGTHPWHQTRSDHFVLVPRLLPETRPVHDGYCDNSGNMAYLQAARLQRAQIC
jgi:hypothetical protein